MSHLTFDSQALMPVLVRDADLRMVKEALIWLVGVLLLSSLAQLAVVLPWTPVPVTGQTLGVTLVALSWGWRRALLVFSSYAVLGFAGMPILARGLSGLSVGPTLGYLIGMALASIVVGYLADRGFTRSFSRSLFAAYIGSGLTLGCGLFGLSFFMPAEQLLVAGLLPFLPGDLVKNLIAASVSWKLRQKV